MSLINKKLNITTILLYLKNYYFYLLIYTCYLWCIFVKIFSLFSDNLDYLYCLSYKTGHIRKYFGRFKTGHIRKYFGRFKTGHIRKYFGRFKTGHIRKYIIT